MWALFESLALLSRDVRTQEVTPMSLHETWIPFMKDLGLDGYAYKGKRAGDSDST